MSHNTIIGRAVTGSRTILATGPRHHPTEDFVAAIARGAAPSPSFRDGLGVQRVLDAVERSAAASSRWTRVNT